MINKNRLKQLIDAKETIYFAKHNAYCTEITLNEKTNARLSTIFGKTSLLVDDKIISSHGIVLPVEKLFETKDECLYAIKQNEKIQKLFDTIDVLTDKIVALETKFSKISEVFNEEE